VINDINFFSRTHKKIVYHFCFLSISCHVHVLCKHTDNYIALFSCPTMCLGISLQEMHSSEVKDEDIKCCPTCTIDLGSAPLEKIMSCLFPSLFIVDLQL
jgi:hypothetical protein